MTILNNDIVESQEIDIITLASKKDLQSSISLQIYAYFMSSSAIV